MALWDKLKGELIDIIEWLDDTGNTLVHRFDRMGNEIKYSAKLVVREGQAAVFINEGALADVFPPGTYTLETKNLPILATLKGWKYGFESPFKAEVYFCSTRQFTNLKWGTPGPATMRDKDFGMVRVTAFGIYAVKIKDPATFIQEVVGTDSVFTTEEIQENLRGKIGVHIKEAMSELGIPVAELEAKVRILGETLRDRLSPEFQKLGVDVTEVQVQDLGLPEEVEKAIDKAGAMRVIGNMQSFAMYEAAGAMKDMAQNPGAGGLAGAGMGMGVGMAIGGQMAQMAGGQARTAAGPPPLPQDIAFYAALEGKQAGPFDAASLGQMVQSGQLTRDTLVWKQGMANWAKAGEVKELGDLFTALPPPIPPVP